MARDACRPGSLTAGPLGHCLPSPACLHLPCCSVLCCSLNPIPPGSSVLVLTSQVRRTYEGLRKSRLDEFMAGFNVISLKLKEMYQVGGQTLMQACRCPSLGACVFRLHRMGMSLAVASSQKGQERVAFLSQLFVNRMIISASHVLTCR